MPTFETRKLSVNFTDTGSGTSSGETVVLLHAGATSSAHWRKVEPLMSRRYRLLAPDLIGFGDSRFLDNRPMTNHGTNRDASHDDQADLVRMMLAHTGQDRVHVVGHSFGGATAVRLALRHPGFFKSLTLIEPVLTPLLHQAGENWLYQEARARALEFVGDADAGRLVAAWRAFIDGHNGEGTWDGLTDRAKERFMTKTMQTAAAYKANLGNPTTLRDLGGMDIPTRVICGENSPEAYRRICSIVWSHIRGCDYETISGAGHMSPLTHAEAVAEAIDEHTDVARWCRPMAIAA